MYIHVSSVVEDEDLTDAVGRHDITDPLSAFNIVAYLGPTAARRDRESTL